MDRRRDLCDFEKGGLKEHRGLKALRESLSVTRDQPNGIIMGISGAASKTEFSTTINKRPNDGISCARMVLHSSNKVPDTCRIYVKAH